ncbi:MAG: glutamine synthetase III [Kiritimatiellae bacterium]|nr:glutamine synthetase III [Kiritimatiellia bacterium]
MSNLTRSAAIDAVANITPPPQAPAAPASLDYFAEDVFNADAMRRYLAAPVCRKLLATIQNNAPLDPEIAGDVAQGMKKWAVDRGATHFTHWFLPLNGSTAEKHDSFLDFADGKAVFSFSAKNLIAGETDASSFPSGGLRSTFEARGYTAWDPTSPAFIKRHGNGATLCIPTAFCSYAGDALDKKTPLLRSMQALASATRRLMKCFGLPRAHVETTLGAEQEYFLIDRHFYLRRPDLIQTGRTVFGAPPPKHQQLEDHYFGSIKARVLNFMTEVEHELWRLGIPAKTRHNEVAPAQFELAPLFEDVNLACDHNMLVMEVLRQTAERNGLVCLLHEKPFDGVNGSGKHNNWSVAYGGRNLLNPGNDPAQNAIFLTVLCAILKGVDDYAPLLRATVAGAGNDHRLGAHEAPPAVISIFLGDQLSGILDQLVDGKAKSKSRAGAMRIGVDTLPPLPRDATDRNRTSPFAFTGNKFEFRAPGSSQSCADPCTALNVITADAFNQFADVLEKLDPGHFNDGLQKLLRETVRAHRRIVFNGDGYSGTWLEEANRRGLPCAATTTDALPSLVADAAVRLYEKYGVFTRRELQSRYEVFAAEYASRIRIEGGVALEMAESMILPAVDSEYAAAIQAYGAAKAAGLARGRQTSRATALRLGAGLDDLGKKTSALRSTLDGEPAAILAAMAALRKTVDALERIVSDDRWPLPKYREMLFLY